MTEEQWLSSADPGPMLLFLSEILGISPRRWRLFACACVRRHWSLLACGERRFAVETAERFADGAESIDALTAVLANLNRLQRCRGFEGNVQLAAGRTAFEPRAAAKVHSDYQYRHGEEEYGWHAASGIAGVMVTAMVRKASRDAQRAGKKAAPFMRAAKQAELHAQAVLVRDVFGLLPFRSPHLNPSWLSWGGRVVAHLAEGIYEERAFDRVPILGDALEEAGCTDADILAHCRAPGEHVRGCWVVDLILGKC